MIEQRAYLRDCMEAMAEFPDKFFDLAVVDPPYGIGAANMNLGIGKGKNCSKLKNRKWQSKNWDNNVPDLAYFDQLRRVSKNQVIWGANHFISRIPIDSSCWIVWDKKIDEAMSFASIELAYTSFLTSAKIFTYSVYLDKGDRYHPTQKPVALYDWIFANYAKAGQKILDTHLGSGSSRIAANKAGLDFWGYELDADYFAAHEKRYANFIAQLRLF